MFQTLADVPSATPVYLSVRMKSAYVNTTRANNINVLVKWSPISSAKWNGIPLGYVLYVATCEQTADSAVSNRRIEIKYSKHRPTVYLMRGLAAHTCYRFNMAAWNSVGEGARRIHDLVLNRTSQSRPSNYTYHVNAYTLNSTAIQVTWKKLGQTYANGLLTGYLIRYAPILDATGTGVYKRVTSDSVISYYDYDDADNDDNADNDLVFMANYRPKEVTLQLNVRFSFT